MKMIIIVGDTNDADYTTAIIRDPDPEFVEVVIRVAKAIQAETQKRIDASPSGHINFHNWDLQCYHSSTEPPWEVYKDILSEDDIEWFTDECPYCDGSIHSIKSIFIVEAVGEERIL